MKDCRFSVVACPIDPGRVLDSDRPIALPIPPGEPLCLQATLRCGQAFRWRQVGDTWYGPYGRGSLAVRQSGDSLEVRALGVEVLVEEAWRFFGLHRSLIDIYARLEHDPWVSAATRAYPGMRLLRQDPWECLAGYICSQNSNIPKIELSTERLACRLGTVHRWPEGVEVAAFPSPEALAGADIETLRATGLGYRCRYLLESARRVAEGVVQPNALRSLDYDAALAELITLPGIGRKVADCILLFALDQESAVPVDVWVRRVIHELYPVELARLLPDARARLEKGLTPAEYTAIVKFAHGQWGGLAGYAQQYLFHARRTGGSMAVTFVER